jgi:LysM repeat protein
MSFRRSLVLALVVSTAIGVYAVTHHTSAPTDSTSAYILITPTVLETSVPTTVATTIIPAPTKVSFVRSVVLTPSPSVTASASSYSVASASDVIDLKKLRSKDVAIEVHKVSSGENYWTLAKKANIDIYTLIGANPTMPFKAAYHMTLNILSQKGILHTVHSDDTLLKLAEKYRTTEKVIQDANHIHWWHPIQTGDVLFIPNVRPLLMVKEWRDYFSKRGMFGVPFSKWATWTSGFGLRVDPFTGKKREHTGVDLRAKYGDPVYASAPGKVIFTGVAGGYGNLIQIAHGHGYVTYYGHLSKIYARMGSKVKRGTLIGRVGATGHVTGPHLHFEIRLNGKPLDPLQFI